jgi:2-succinyl-5-enolpyruvyl-6-hydroxy-3-cyclohexene-1-carboxylate synthase
VDEIAERVSRSPRGLIICGRQLDGQLASPVAALAAGAGYPILPEPTSQLRVGHHDRDLVVWPYDWIARHRAAGLAPELVIRFGDMPTSKALRLWLDSLPDLRQVVVDPAFGWNDPSRKAETVVRAEPRSFAADLADRLRGGAPEWRRAWIEAGKEAARAVEAELAQTEAATEPGVHATLAHLYQDDDLVYTASSMPIRDQEGLVPSLPKEVTFLCNRGANGIDGLISSGIGAAVASGRPTWIITGDLGLYHDMNGLAALRAAAAPLRIVVLNNDGGGIFEFLPQAGEIDRDEFEAILGTPLGIDPARVAELHGLQHVLVDDLTDLATAAEVGTAIIEIPVDRQRNVEVHRRIADRAAEALSAISR